MIKVFNVMNTSNTMENHSRSELLGWLNSCLHSEFRSVDELCTGAAYCQLMDMLFPNSVPMKRVKFMPKLEHEFIQNFKILQLAFDKIGVKQEIPVEKLIKGRFQDNFQFLQWSKKFYDANCGRVSENYDARAVREGAPMGFGLKAVMNTTPGIKEGRLPKLRVTPRTLAAESAGTLSSDKIIKGPIPMSQSPRVVLVDQQKQMQIEPESSTISHRNLSKTEMSPSSNIEGELDPESSVQKIYELNNEIQRLNDQLKWMRQRVLDTEIERDFYYSACLEVEKLCQSQDELGGILPCKQIYDIIYARGSDFPPPDDPEE